MQLNTNPETGIKTGVWGPGMYWVNISGWELGMFSERIQNESMMFSPMSTSKNSWIDLLPQRIYKKITSKPKTFLQIKLKQHEDLELLRPPLSEICLVNHPKLISQFVFAGRIGDGSQAVVDHYMNRPVNGSNV